MTELNIEVINKEISTHLANKETANALLKTTFKGLQEVVMKQAIMEGMIRGFTFRDFLQKNLYAVPFAGGYSLITSIDFARKIGMKNGMCGKSEPTYEEKDGAIISCTVTIKRKIGDYIGDYTAKVYFSEYSTGRQLWSSKPRTMIAKVAEMHALRSAFPEDLSQIYTEEELEKETVNSGEVVAEAVKEYDPTLALEMLKGAKDLADLKDTFLKLPAEAKQNSKVVELKDILKTTLK